MNEAAKKTIRFVITGGSVFLVSGVLLYVLHEKLSMWYLLASSIMYVFGTLLNFLLQKMWVFRSVSSERAKNEFMGFFGVSIVNILCNVCFMYVLVSVFSVHYLMSQALTILTLSVFNYYVYGRFIFIIAHKARQV